MSIELPKDAEGREIPLDTKVLYDADGDQYEVSRFAYWVSRDYDNWDVVFANEYDRYASETLLSPPTPPDSWEKLEDDLSRCTEYAIVNASCRYLNPTNKCSGCPIQAGSGDCFNREAFSFKDILRRIRKLRGEDE